MPKQFRTTRLLIAVLIAVLSLPCTAHEGGHGESTSSARTWYRTDGSHIHGTFISVQGPTLRVLSSTGKIISVELNQLSEPSRQWVEREKQTIDELNKQPRVRLVSQTGAAQTANNSAERPALADSFKAFEKSVTLRWDRNFLFVESNGIPDHPMMVGIRSWQQQVPLPQNYRGNNAWRIPLQPVPAPKPISANGRFLRGAIALAVNGIPIFNPLNNRGDDSYLFGELDEYGGHCGRADDYHYHIAPIHLEKLIEKGTPLAYALDGYPIYGYQDPASPDFAPLDTINGHKDSQGNYHYHATEKYPYINGGFYGKVVEREGQVDPQPRAEPIRPAMQPLRGAKITGFERDETSNQVILKYEQNNKQGSVQYVPNAEGYQFTFTDPNGKVTKESYRLRNEGKRPPQRQEPRPEPRGRNDERPRPGDQAKTSNAQPMKDERPSDDFILLSPAFSHHGALPIEFAGDGQGISPPLKWLNAPATTKFFALQLWHKPNPNGNEVKSYWVVSSIPANVTSLEKNNQAVGLTGLNDKRRAAYDPMNSKGPGLKEYHITLYALSAEPKLTAGKFTRADLLESIKNITLAESTLSYSYERKAR